MLGIYVDYVVTSKRNILELMKYKMVSRRRVEDLDYTSAIVLLKQ